MDLEKLRQQSDELREIARANRERRTGGLRRFGEGGKEPDNPAHTESTSDIAKKAVAAAPIDNRSRIEQTFSDTEIIDALWSILEVRQSGMDDLATFYCLNQAANLEESSKTDATRVQVARLLLTGEGKERHYNF